MVRADRDVEARVWVAYSDVPGLATGASALEDVVSAATLFVQYGWLSRLRKRLI